MLLYDPNKFNIEENKQIIIKTGENGFFKDSTVKEVLRIANGRKILYISDIRITDKSDFYKNELIIYKNSLEQQKWGIMMGAEFILLKFRMFFYQKSYEEIDFIDNTFVDDLEIKDKIVYIKNEKYHNNKNLWMLYLSGKIYSQIYAGRRSTETRLFVKKIKYYKNKNKFSENDMNKYYLRYYNNLTYESVLNYYNINIRHKQYAYKNSILYSKYIPNYEGTYENTVEYSLFRKYLIYTGKIPSILNVLNLAYLCYTFLNINYKNNSIICISVKNNIKEENNKKILDCYYINSRKELIMSQFDRIFKNNKLDQDIKNKFIASYDIDKFKTNGLYEIKKGILNVFCKSVDKKTYMKIFYDKCTQDSD